VHVIIHLIEIDTIHIQTLEDILREGRLPSKLLEHSDVEFCPGLEEPTDLEPIPEQVPILMVIGTQKTGTTWLFRALNNHTSFIASKRLVG
jgi:hypothetical protein